MTEEGCVWEEDEPCQPLDYHGLYWGSWGLVVPARLPLLRQLLLLHQCQVCFPDAFQECVPTGKKIMQEMFYQQEPSAEAKPPRVENTFGATTGAWWGSDWELKRGPKCRSGFGRAGCHYREQKRDHVSRLKSWSKKYASDKRKSLFPLTHYIPGSSCARCF